MEGAGLEDGAFLSVPFDFATLRSGTLYCWFFLGTLFFP